ncbi:GNAT family N-acetyltransferase [Demequina sp.]|uniref:lipid II:glycine glycyltransferase FemX n=1 Tax=Demequina sp. TaxID=2050685 RepID=UPI0025BD4887|nr:GNAT family N-acetyltransferase [Demequina sp.]
MKSGDEWVAWPVGDEVFLAAAAAAGVQVPLEQAPVWDRFDAATEGRSHLARLAVGPDGGAPVALISLSAYSLRGFPYVWARHAPLMLVEPTPDAEFAVRDALIRYSKEEWTDVVFMRLHARHRAPDLRPLLQSVTYDRTVVIDVQRPADEYLASLSKKFRYTVRQALKHDDVVVADETEAAAADFTELHEIYQETAERDGFGIFDAEVYRAMVDALQPHARVFVARHTSAEDPRGRAIAWAIVTDYEGAAHYVYAGASQEARELDATVRLLWDVLAILRSKSVRTFDMGGVDSDLAPSLASVGLFKRKWGAESAVDPAWDVPAKRSTYALLVGLLRAKRLLTGRR